MSFFSKSSKGKHYRNGHQGSGHYQQKGLLGSILGMINSSHSGGHYGRPQHASNQQPYQVPNQNMAATSAQCPQCRTPIVAGSKFCLQCGQKVSSESMCTGCGDKLAPGANFCMNCGKKANG